MPVVRWLDEHAEDTCTFLFYLYLSLIVFIEVFRRYVLNASSSWGVETAIYAFIWMVYVAAAKGAKERSHLSLSMWTSRMGKKGRFASLIISDICFATLAVIVVYYSSLMVTFHLTNGINMQGAEIPFWLASAAVPAGWTLLLFRVIQRSIRTVIAYRAGEDVGISAIRIAE